MQRQMKAQMLKARSLKVARLLLIMAKANGCQPVVKFVENQGQQLIGQVDLIVFAVQVLQKRPHNGRAKLEFSAKRRKVRGLLLLEMVAKLTHIQVHRLKVTNQFKPESEQLGRQEKRHGDAFMRQKIHQIGYD
jgi:hypothetical protein